MSKKSFFHWRYMVSLLSLALIGWFIYSRWQDLSAMPAYLKRVGMDTLFLLASLEFLFLLAAAQSNRLVYRSLAVHNSLAGQLQLLLAAGTIERILPSGGAAGMSSYVWLARNRGILVADSVKMTATTFVLGYAQIVPLLLIPLIFMDTFSLPRTKSELLIGISGGFVILVIGCAAVLGSERLRKRMESLRLFRRFPRLLAGIMAAHAHVRFSWQTRKHLVAPLFLLWGLYPIRFAMLSVCFAAFDANVSLPLIWTGYSITILISFLTFLPTTLGIFELSMVGTFAMLGVSTELATAVTLLYRFFTYWVPIPFGLFSWWSLRRRKVLESGN